MWLECIRLLCVKMLAKDGKPYDIVAPSVNKPLESNEVEVIQYMRADIMNYAGGERRKMVATLDYETARKADNLIITATILKNNEVLMCARFQDEPKESKVCIQRKNDLMNPETGNRYLTELIDKITKRGRLKNER